MVVYIHDGGTPAVLKGLPVANSAPVLVEVTGRRHRPARPGGVLGTAGSLTRLPVAATTVWSGPQRPTLSPRGADGSPHPYATDESRSSTGASTG
ncbi:hypothetical protein AB0D32_02625 [Micromonospora sp. NPDC048170]|uniref:hypothetical protein n=1 Tax=Micromonospora sp. NPDC048170 TaxID=3154819 RepID=UPI0033D950A8